MDVKRFIRLRAAIEEAMAAVRPEDAAASGKAMPESYVRLRAQVLELLGDEDPSLVEELNALCPYTDWPQAGRGDLFKNAAVYNEARSYLARMLGWLKGIIEGEQYESQVAANAAAYASERVRQERQIGFGKT